MSIRVEFEALPDVVADHGEVAYLTTVGHDRRVHIVAVRGRWVEGELVVGAGRRTMANIAVSTAVTVLWVGSPGAEHSLIVDGTARLVQSAAPTEIAVRPTGAVLHRLPEGDAG